MRPLPAVDTGFTFYLSLCCFGRIQNLFCPSPLPMIRVASLFSNTMPAQAIGQAFDGFLQLLFRAEGKVYAHMVRLGPLSIERLPRYESNLELQGLIK